MRGSENEEELALAKPGENESEADEEESRELSTCGPVDEEY